MGLYRLFLLVFLLFVAGSGHSQTCCSGGVPLAGNLGLPAGQQGQLQVGISYDLNRLRRLFTEADRLDATSRTRNTQTVLLEASYAFTDRISLDALVPYIRQERIISRAVTTRDETTGLGDAVLLLRYQWITDQQEPPWQWASGIGVKLPNGAADIGNDFGITYNADLQPGSNAWDFILWNRISHQPVFRPSLSVFLTTVHRQRGVNDNYLPITNPTTGNITTQTYQFGAETQLTLGVTDQWLAFRQVFTPGLSLLYRRAVADRTNGTDTPSTGGNFLFVQPSVALAIGQQLQWQLAVDLPAYTRVMGTQVAPSIRLNTGVLVSLGRPHRLQRVELPVSPMNPESSH